METLNYRVARGWIDPRTIRDDQQCHQFALNNTTKPSVNCHRRARRNPNVPTPHPHLQPLVAAALLPTYRSNPPTILPIQEQHHHRPHHFETATPTTKIHSRPPQCASLARHLVPDPTRTHGHCTALCSIWPVPLYRLRALGLRDGSFWGIRAERGDEI